jgi:hypothetical protein
MEVDPFFVGTKQSDLLGFGSSSTVSPEYLMVVWSAAEALTSPDLATRWMGLERLVDSDAVSCSPLVAYLIATRLTEPDIELRARLVRTLAGVLSPSKSCQTVSQAVIHHLSNYLSQMGVSQVTALLQVAEHESSTQPSVAKLLGRCSLAGNYLADISVDRQVSQAIRRQSVYFIGLIGYLDALPALERLETRLESRLNGQQSFLEGPASGNDETSMLPLLREALVSLRAL